MSDSKQKPRKCYKGANDLCEHYNKSQSCIKSIIHYPENPICPEQPAERKTLSPRFKRAMLSAQVVLGPVALRQVFTAACDQIIDNNELGVVKSELVRGVLHYIDKAATVKVAFNTESPDLPIRIVDNRAHIGPNTFNGYTLVDIKSSISHDLDDDPAAFFMEALGMVWDRDLTIEDMQEITHHIEKIISIIHS